jgi:hypothetical protein
VLQIVKLASMHVCSVCRVTLRLHREAQYKDERMRERREHQEEEIGAAARHARAQAMQDGTAQRSSGGGSRSAGRSSGGGSEGPSAAFYERQQALLERRKQREAQRRPSDEDELEECVCESQPPHPYARKPQECVARCPELLIHASNTWLQDCWLHSGLAMSACRQWTGASWQHSACSPLGDV